MHPTENQESKGAISWIARHGVAANLLMAACIFGGLLLMLSIKQEVFPDFEIDTITVTVAYPGASPEEVENGILLVIEDALSGLDGIDEVKATASEGSGLVVIEVESDADIQQLAQDVQQEVNRITTFPSDIEEPKIKILSRSSQVLSVVLHGAAEERVLHELAEQFRDQLLQDPNISRIELAGIRPLEISIEVPQENLRRYKLSLAEIAQRIQNASIDLPGGSVKTSVGEILIRMKERKDYGREFAQIPIINAANGSVVLLGEIATINDSYKETDYSASYNGQPAVMVQVLRVGKQTPVQISDAVKRNLKLANASLPQGISAEIRYDASVQYGQRIDLLMRNSAMGLTLVFIVLALFLELRLAFWVMMGIPTAFLGSFLLLPLLGVSLNMVSLFAFIIALGIVVDDAIVVGEHVYHFRQQGMAPMQAAIKGAREMAAPVTFSILSNIAAFIPLFFIPGEIGKIFFMIPVVIITVFSFSLIESIFILPNHLGHLMPTGKKGVQSWIHHHQQRFSHAFKHWVEFRYGGFLDRALQHRYLTIVIAIALLVSTLAYALSGRMGMSTFPKTESDYAKVTVTMPYGTPIAKTQAVVQKIVADAQKTTEKIKNGDQLILGIFTEVGKRDSNKAEIRAYLAAPEIREKIVSTEQFNQLWRQQTGDILGIKSVLFESDAGGPGSGAAITIELNHSNPAILEQASRELADALRAYPIVKDVDDGFSPGKQQLDFSILPEGKSLGLTAQNVARQVRNAFFGAEVLRQQRGRNEIRVMVRLPENERILETHVEDLLIWTNPGPASAQTQAQTREIPLREVVQVNRGRAYMEIDRRNGRRNIQVTANVTPKSKAGEILNDLKITELPRLLEQYPGLHYSFEGQEADMAESMGSLKLSFVFALLGIYVLLALPFQSYVMPLIVIASIPFGIIGAVLGHLLMGYDLSIISVLGMVALSGVVINDALVLIDHATSLRKQGLGMPAKIIKLAAIQRFRPIILTTLTTFGGLMPMILETSRQAKILIPMAISIGFGILFATLITLILIPSLYLAVDDISRYLRKTKTNHDG
ncbi:MAG: efflux RND transporter permease subunit [Methylobacter sp.]|nr:efflux RND transporter permease subunit [Methylobacter sp.]MDP2428506.1 efflux RND transporter permease subunit [Methylobacter sp.]MDP3056250.1 efflux RND transporter permease subunit [Methylobacter sp.]MDP3363781.1 efflux RND transporter permease subunit [Methylobacter sp.]MDZ4219317.1 efflux RND transporter permease subunit [Methylobacter sp.]